MTPTVAAQLDVHLVDKRKTDVRSSTRTELNPPVNSGVRCRHCLGMIAANAQFESGPGYRWYAWTHTDGRRECRPIQYATPADFNDAETQVRATLDGVPVTFRDATR